MTVSRLRTELTDAELVHFAAFYEVKGEREEKSNAVVQSCGGSIDLLLSSHGKGFEELIVEAARCS